MHAWRGAVVLQRGPGLIRARPMSTDVSVAFDTHRAFLALQEAGFTKSKSEAILEVLKGSLKENETNMMRDYVTMKELLDAKSELREQVFNNTLKFELGQKHTREMLDRDLQSLKSDLRELERQDFATLRDEITSVEKHHLERMAKEDEKFATMYAELTKIENRFLSYAAGE